MKKKKWLSLLLASVMTLSLLPMAVSAEGNTPSWSGNVFFANGVPVTITGEAPDGGTQVNMGSFSAPGTDAYISWSEGSEIKYVGVAKNASVVGGSLGASAPVTVERTSITMTGGTVHNIFGGNYGADKANGAEPSKVTGDVTINVSGEANVYNMIYAGGAYNTAVEGTVYVNITDADLVTNSNMCYVNGGVYGNGKEGTRDIANNKMITNAVANNVVINVSNSKVPVLGGGGSGSTKVNSATVTVSNSDVDYLYLGGINGETVSSSLTVTGDCSIVELAAVNRGFVGNAVANIESGSVENFATGAAVGCFSSDSGSPDGSAVSGSVEWNFGENATVTNAQITPNVVRDADKNYTADFGGTTINKAGAPLEMSADTFTPVISGSGNVDLKEFIVSENNSLHLSGVELTIPADITVTNQGGIGVGENAQIKAAAGSTLRNAANATITVSKTGTLISEGGAVDNDGAIEVYDGGKTEGVIGGEEPVNYYTISAAAGEGGSISPAGQVTVKEGESASFTIKANDGYRIADVKVNGVSKGAVETVTVENVTAPGTVEASFEAVHTHNYDGAWKSDANSHWKECSCGEKADLAAHSFGEWTVVKEASAEADGSKERVCSVCGYKETAVIPATGTSSQEENPSSGSSSSSSSDNLPQTGESSNLTLWAVLAVLSAACLGGVVLCAGKSRVQGKHSK